MVTRAADTRRGALYGILISLGLHGGAMLLLLLPIFLPAFLPRAPISMEILPARKLALPPAPAAEAAPKDPPQRAKAEAAAAGPRAAAKAPGKPARPRPPVAPAVDSLADLPQEGASVVLVLRMAGLRRSPHRAAAAGLLSAFPDARILALGTDLTAAPALGQALIDRLSALVITTTDPRDLFATALLAVHEEGDRALIDKLQARPAPPWEPRRFTDIDERVAAFAGDEVIGQWQASRQGASWQRRLRGLIEAPAAVTVEIHHLDQLVRVAQDVPTPTAVRLAVSAEAAPGVRLLFDMASESEATALVALLPALRQRFEESLRWVGLSPLLRGLTVSRQRATVSLVGRLPQAEVALLLTLLQFSLERLPLPTPAPASASPPIAAPADGAPSGEQNL